jgi:methylenetetrahydrofolate dehydrogenase (NADP+) / methenyltetrahydrofolate cyclohydrolase
VSSSRNRSGSTSAEFNFQFDVASATLMDGAALAARLRTELKNDVAELGQIELATVLVGEDPASQVYIRLKHKAAEEAGIRAIDRRLPEGTREEELLDVVAELNDDDSIDGVLVQTPLPPQIDEGRVMRTIDPMKDVDGLHPFNAGQLFFGRPTFVGATPVGIMRVLDEYGIPVEGARAVVVGRSLIVGRPVAMLLLHGNATVTICHSRTRDLARHTLDADILVVAVGQAAAITADMVKVGAAVVDVGINRTEAGLVGDVDPGVAEVAAFLTPVPGGIGPMTIACLLENALRAARYRRGALAFPLI